MSLYLLVAGTAAAQSGAKLLLHDGWEIRPAAEIRDSGDALSIASYQSRGWYPATVPTTVMAALVADKVYPDPYFGMNLRSIPGMTYPIGANFSNIPMPPGSPFRGPWWYRTDFSVPNTYSGKHVQLHFDGVNFRANVWMNGKQVAKSSDVAGAWRLFAIDASSAIKPGTTNSLAVEVFPPTPDDLAITFVDWNPSPPDKGMGIWRDVYLTATGPATIESPSVVTALDLPSLAAAHLTVLAELRNWTERPVAGVLTGHIGQINFRKSVTVPAGRTENVTFTPAEFAPLNIAHPRVWWPAGLGEQALYDLKLKFDVEGQASDEKSIRFGIRQVTSHVDQAQVRSMENGETATESRRVFQINGRNILIRGAGYSFDMLLRESPEREEQELQYVRDMHLNTVRLEGKLVDDHYLQLADEYGILITAGWCCCDHWEQWKQWDAEDRRVAAASLHDQIRRLRTHPSVFNWMNGSDNPPPPDIERMYIGILKDANWPNPYESSATERETPVTGATGVKMTGPYDYVPPSYWSLDTSLGGAHGFNSETSPGPAVPPIESLREMLPADELWPVNRWWDYHAGGGVFKNINTFTKALRARYGESRDASQYALTAQVMEYEGERAMFEAYGANKYTATGVIQWMLNNAWPSVIWHLYDYYLRPGGGYFGTKKACEPVHVQYSYADHSVTVVNSTYKGFQNLTASVEVYNLDLSSAFKKDVQVSVDAGGVTKVLTIPELNALSATYFLRLRLTDGNGQQISSNFYWLSTHPDELNWKKSTWYYTPESAYADFNGLHELPPVALSLNASSKIDGAAEVTAVTIKNPTRHLAFFAHLKVSKQAKDPDDEEPAEAAEVLPVLWSDNYIVLMPGEERTLTARYRSAGETSGPAVVSVDGWNVVPQTVTAAEAK